MEVPVVAWVYIRLKCSRPLVHLLQPASALYQALTPPSQVQVLVEYKFL
jgi:hypothetical protein